MRVAGLALVCVVIGGGAAIGFLAAERESLAISNVLGLFNIGTDRSDAKSHPSPNREGKFDRLAPLRTDRMDVDQTLRRGDSLRQSYAAVDPTAPAPQSQLGPTPVPKPRPKAMLLRRQQASYTLLSDLQIDAIKSRLKLNVEQERLWPEVEDALRALAMRLHDMKKAGQAPTELQTDSPEFAKLRAATAPFVATLTADQKRELRMLAHLIGLAKVVAQL